MPFRLLRYPPCSKKTYTKLANSLCDGHFLSENHIRQELALTFGKLFITVPIVTGIFYTLISWFIKLNIPLIIDIAWVILNITILTLIGIALIGIICLYRKALSDICLSSIKLKFHTLQNKARVHYKDMRPANLDRFIQIEWER